MTTDKRCTIAFCDSHTVEKNGTTTHTVELPGGTVCRVQTEGNGRTMNIIRDDRPWQWQPDRGE